MTCRLLKTEFLELPILWCSGGGGVGADLMPVRGWAPR